MRGAADFFGFVERFAFIAGAFFFATRFAGMAAVYSIMLWHDDQMNRLFRIAPTQNYVTLPSHFFGCDVATHHVGLGLAAWRTIGTAALGR